jgi:hypothetical protein
MKVTARLILTVAILASLAVSQFPAPAHCQMGFGTVFARSCPMPCCKTKLPMPNCPFLKASIPHDFIASSTPVLDNALIPLPTSLQIKLPGLRPLSQIFANLAATIQTLFAGPPPSVRAPPVDAHLLDA